MGKTKSKSKSILRKNSNLYSSAPDRFDDAMEQQATATAILKIPTTTTTATTTVLPQPLVKPLRQKSNDNEIDANDIEDNDGNDDNDSGSIDLEEILECDNFEQEEEEVEVEVE